MKILSLLSLLLALLAAQPAATTYRLDPAASTLTWTGHAEVGSWAPQGIIRLREGQLVADGQTVRRARVVFDMTSIAHDQAQLAEHLRGPDFFDATKYPAAVFELTDFKAGQARGMLTLKGQTKPIAFPATVTAVPGGGLRLSGTATIDRTLFGINFNSTSFFQNLGSYAVRNDFQLTFDVVAR
ncbi:YceI family protein [Hymenobacter sp. BT683]|uniref:YceI family protein n=1 Tax=Hymenobacter jeongseonensis TaxID=2791027 RepID=A0ABS0IIB5_9BACT|nr:YceI family protein [Hymenobacter jeongseonensis]MBF9238110.1 YceI family protein [Hymenobacter jeongseonensis]